MAAPEGRPIVRHAIEVDCRLDVLADVLALRHQASRRAIVAAIATLLPTLREHSTQLGDDNDPHGPLPARLAHEIALLST